ncbi:MAG TPA: YceH family protein [Burkholderiaceae bacterium]|nr:YceH family protein [Burkholderiaceae bacterium]
MPTLAPLSLLEARVLGVLVEKEKTVPDTYPLSLNALTAGCNQKNNRDPVLNARETEVLEAVDVLKGRSFVIESSGARVSRYSHNVGRVLRVPDQSVALLASLMLRGPQTAAELRLNTERLHNFADVSSVDAFLDELAARGEAAGGPLVVKLPRRPGEREARWAHLLCGEVPMAAEPPPVARAESELAALHRRVEALEQEVAELRRQLNLRSTGG